MCRTTGESMMKHDHKRGILIACVAVIGLAVFSGQLFGSDSGPGTDYDNQGSKIFSSLQVTPELYLQADSGDRNLAGFYDLRQYPGSPPRIPHEVDFSFSGKETDCLSCHVKGGYSPEFGKFVPVMPHPENSLCYQCHATLTKDESFVDTDWQSVPPPRLGQSFLSSSPPPVPHSLQLRENCIACHTGPGAVTELRVEHANRGDCRQCHAVVVRTESLQVFKRKP